MSILAPALARSVQRLAPKYKLPEDVERRIELLRTLERQRSLSTELPRVADLLSRPEDQGGVKRNNKLFDRAAFGKFRGVISAARSLGTKRDKKTLKSAVKDASKWIEHDNAKLHDAARDNVTWRKRAAAVWVAEEARLALEMEELSQLEVNESSAAVAAKVQAHATQVEVLKLLATDGSCTPPSSKGASDSFFIEDASGKPVYIFKPVEGENDPKTAAESLRWPKGGGAAREVALSRFNEDMKTKLGLDFGVAKTIAVKLDSGAFRAGEKSQAVTRTGALQTALACNEKSPEGWFGLDDGTIRTAEETRAYKDSFKVEDVQKIAVLDFLTLNLDRNPGNVIIYKHENGSRSIAPIDAGNCLPPPKILENYADTMTADLPARSAPILAGNLLAQLPQATEPFAEALLVKLRNLNPAEIAGSMRAAATLDGDLAGKIDTPTVDMVELSAKFLKTAVGLPMPAGAAPLCPYEVSIMYAKHFPAYRRSALLPLAAEEDAASRESTLQRLVSEAAAAARLKLAQDRLATEYADLGGDGKLAHLGYNVRDEKSVTERLALLRAGLPEPTVLAQRDALLRALDETADSISAATKLGPKFTGRALKDQIEELKDYTEIHNAGGDRALASWLLELTRQGVPNLKEVGRMSLGDKNNFLKQYKELESLGGMPQYHKYADLGAVNKEARLPSLAQIVSAMKEAKKKAGGI